MNDAGPWSGRLRTSAVASAVSAIALFAWSCYGLQRPSVNTGATYFTDDQSTQVWTPSATVAAYVAEETEVEAGWTADVISSASVDVVSAASTGISELRQEMRVAATTSDVVEGAELGASYTYSFERDADGHVASLTFARSLAEESVDLSVGYNLAHSRLGVGGSPRDTWRPAWIHNPQIGVDIVLGRATLLGLVYSTFVADGYQANPYRRVNVGGPEFVALNSVEERVPTLRWRNAWMARLQAGFGGRWLTSLSYRLYLDDWGVLSHTEVGEVAYDVAPVFTVGVHQRVTRQGAADFYQQYYEELTDYRTRDRRLSGQVSLLGGLWAAWAVRDRSPGTVDVRAGVDVVAWRYDDFVAPDHAFTGEADFTPLGWVRAVVTRLEVEVRP